MSQVEFEKWIAFHKSHPLDDEHRIYAPAALLAAVTHRAGKQMSYYVDMLMPRDYNNADASIFQAFGLKPPRG